MNRRKKEEGERGARTVRGGWRKKWRGEEERRKQEEGRRREEGEKGKEGEEGEEEEEEGG